MNLFLKYRQHRVVHTADKPYSCPKCGVCYNRKFSLNRYLINFQACSRHQNFAADTFFKLCHGLNFFLASGDLSSAGNLCKQFGPGTKLFDTLIVFLKEFLEKDLKKSRQIKKKNHEIYPACNEFKKVLSCRSELIFLKYQVRRFSGCTL